MADLNESTVQVLVDLNVILNVQNYITVRLRDLDTREVPFATFEDFCQHFLFENNCFQFFKLGQDDFTDFLSFRVVVLNLSNEVLFTFTFRNAKEYVHIMDVAEMFYEGEVD